MTDYQDSPADWLELALQFGMIMMFACAFPLAFAFATLVYNAFCGTSTMCFFFSLIFYFIFEFVLIQSKVNDEFPQFAEQHYKN